MKLFEKKAEPDVEGLLAVIRRSALPKKVHHIELFLDEEIKQQVCERFDIEVDSDEPYGELQREIKLHRFLGYDAFRVGVRSDELWTLPRLMSTDTTDSIGQKRSEREWRSESTGPIQSWEDFEAYPWPKLKDVDFARYEWLDKNLPENMGCYDLTAHIIEVGSWLMGFESFALKMYDEPDLVDAIFQKVGEFYVEYTRRLCEFDNSVLMWGSDDMGFRTSTLISADVLREKVLPWHKKCAEISHQNNRPYLLHSCGYLEQIMDDLIDDVGIDAKHSFEDVIMPVTEVKEKYGRRMAILGGIDVDFLCRSDEEAVRKRTRETLDVCMPGGGYCLGTGNSVANYIPLDNYLVMLDEGRRYTV